MLVYRLSKEQYCRDVSGYGAKLYGGRWNLIGSPCIYTSQSRALALLEFSVNVGMEFTPKKLYFSVFEINDADINSFKISDLPQNWNAIPSSATTKIFGTNQLKNATFLAFKVPSVVIPTEYNIIINPLKINSENLKILGIEEYEYDFRIKK